MKIVPQGEPPFPVPKWSISVPNSNTSPRFLSGGFLSSVDRNPPFGNWGGASSHEDKKPPFGNREEELELALVGV